MLDIGYKATAGRWDAIAPAPGPLHPTREAWLYAAAGLMAPRFKALGHKLPPLRLAIGFPSSGRGSATLAECWHGAASQDGVTEIWIAPQYGLGAEDELLAFLAHELCHAVLGPGVGHGKPFGQLAGALGLLPPYATYKKGASIGPVFRQWLGLLMQQLGPIPHGAHILGGAGWLPGMGDDTPRGKRGCGGSDHKPQRNRMVKCQCATCGYVARVARSWLGRQGPPQCVGLLGDHGLMQPQEVDQDGEGASGQGD